jgi:hypothetical protein
LTVLVFGCLIEGMEDQKLHFLVVVEIPQPVGDCVSVLWKEFLQKIGDTNVLPSLPVHNPSTHGERLAENTWLLNTPAALPFLARLIALLGPPYTHTQMHYSVAALRGPVELFRPPDTATSQKPA